MDFISLKTQHFREVQKGEFVKHTNISKQYLNYHSDLKLFKIQNSSAVCTVYMSVCLNVSPGWRTDQWIQWFHKKEQTFCGLKGLVLEDTPVSRGSCKAFCMQNC